MLRRQDTVAASALSIFGSSGGKDVSKNGCLLKMKKYISINDLAVFYLEFEIFTLAVKAARKNVDACK